jgi:hypothetical protein
VRLEDLTCDDILRAVALYVELAWAEVEGEQTTMRYDVARLQGKRSLE